MHILQINLLRQILTIIECNSDVMGAVHVPNGEHQWERAEQPGGNSCGNRYEPKSVAVRPL